MPRILKPVISLVLLCLLAACASLPESALVYDPQPDAVVIDVDIHYPGLPPTQSPNACYRPSLPALRIWGDGFVYLDPHIQNVRSAVWTGTLRPATLNQVLAFLNSHSFFMQWTPEAPNPAGTWERTGVKLKDRPAITHENFNYSAIFKIIQPELSPLTAQANPDPRAEAILQENAGCDK